MVRHRFYLLKAMLLLVVALLCTSHIQGAGKTEDPLKIAVCAQQPPYHFVDDSGTLTGKASILNTKFMNDYLMRLFL